MRTGTLGRESSLEPRTAAPERGARPLQLARLALLVVLPLACAVVFALRNPGAFTSPNVFGEDATIFFDNIINDGPLSASFSFFNGYLVVGVYALSTLAIAPVLWFGAPFTALPLLAASVSCLALGVFASLPVLMFRRQMGLGVALLATLVLTFVPLPFSDVDVIGVIGNLKFAFAFLAVLLVVARAFHRTRMGIVVVIDALLLLCVLTNAPSVAILPFLFLPFLGEIIAALRARSIRLLMTPERISAVVLCLLSAVYLVVVFVRGIPKFPGYLDSPFPLGATIPLVSHSSVYAFVYPFMSQLGLPNAAVSATSGQALMATATVLGTLAAILAWAVARKRGRRVFLLGLWTCALTSIAFVANRPGVGEYLRFGGTADQFFYAQCMIFAFATIWLVGARLRSRGQRLAFGTVTVLLVVASLPFGSSFGENSHRTDHIGTFAAHVESLCAEDDGSDAISIPIYPIDWYRWDVAREIACAR